MSCPASWSSTGPHPRSSTTARRRSAGHWEA